MSSPPGTTELCSASRRWTVPVPVAPLSRPTLAGRGPAGLQRPASTGRVARAGCCPASGPAPGRRRHDLRRPEATGSPAEGMQQTTRSRPGRRSRTAHSDSPVAAVALPAVNDRPEVPSLHTRRSDRTAAHGVMIPAPGPHAASGTCLSSASSLPSPGKLRPANCRQAATVKFGLAAPRATDTGLALPTGQQEDRSLPRFR